MKTFKTIIIVLFCLCYLRGYSKEPITGIWGINFGDSYYKTMEKLKERYSLDEIEQSSDMIIIENPRIGTERFDNVIFTFKNNKLEDIMFNKIKSYEDGYFKQLDLTDAKDWIEHNRNIVGTSITNIAETISQKYGDPDIGDSNALATWKDDEGNFIELVIQETLDLGMNQSGFYEVYGAMPAIIIAVHYANKSLGSGF